MISTKLFQQLIIGGMHKVYEIGKNYRNEGIDLTHNPEFTAIECYEAFADYEDWIKYTEDLLSSLVLEVSRSHSSH
jgi:lysyl-tRNA synthetase class 2